MITNVDFSNLGPIADLNWQPSPQVNVIIGHNASGKTLLMKMLWALVRSRESWKRGDDPRTYREVLADKLYWTFEVPRLGQIVRQGQDRLEALITEQVKGKTVESAMALGARAERKPRAIEPECPSTCDAIFVPAKEVLSVAKQVKMARQNQQFGFGEPTADLVSLLEVPKLQGKPPFGRARQTLEDLVGARIDLIEGNWILQAGHWKLPVSVVAEGHKRIAIFDRLILNRMLRKDSLLFIDEPEAFLHPEALLAFLRILLQLSESGVQLFLATHSLVVLNALRVYAESKKCSVSTLSLLRGEEHVEYRVDDLMDGMPKNAIVDASIRLYEMEMMGSLDGI